MLAHHRYRHRRDAVVPTPLRSGNVGQGHVVMPSLLLRTAPLGMVRAAKQSSTASRSVRWNGCRAKVCVRHLSLWRLSAAKYNTVPENQLRASAHLLYGSLSSYLHYLMMATLGARERRYYTTYGCSVISCPV